MTVACRPAPVTGGSGTETFDRFGDRRSAASQLGIESGASTWQAQLIIASTVRQTDDQ